MEDEESDPAAKKFVVCCALAESATVIICVCVHPTLSRLQQACTIFLSFSLSLASLILFSLSLFTFNWFFPPSPPRSYCIEASKSVAVRALKRLNPRHTLEDRVALFVYPGGEKEQLLTVQGKEIVYLKERKGFVKLALEQVRLARSE